MRFFYSTALGSNADIERHRKEIADLNERADRAEKEGNLMVMRTYRRLAHLCEESLVDVLSKKFNY